MNLSARKLISLLISFSPLNGENGINNEAQTTATKLEIDDRVHKLHKQHYFITVKDQKNNFPNNPQFRLINPFKISEGNISYVILKRPCNYTRNVTGVNQWKNTKDAINSFVNIKIRAIAPLCNSTSPIFTRRLLKID